MAVKAKKSKAAKAAPAPEVDELEVDVDEVETEEEAPKAPAKPKAEKIEFGSQWLADHVNEECGTSYTPYSLRILLRKLTKDGALERSEAEGRARYSFTGPKDPQVKAIVKAVKSGEAEKAQKERLDGLKEKRSAAKKTTTKKGKKAAPEVEPDVDDDDDIEVEDI